MKKIGVFGSKNRQGFTMIELLSIIVILGIIVTVATVSYNSYIKDANTTYYDNLSQVFKSTIMDYYSDNKAYLPLEVGDFKEIDSSFLISNKYLDKFVDTKEFECEGKGTVQKVSTSDYYYKTCIRCASYNDNKWFGDGCEESESNIGKYKISVDIPETYSQGRDVNGNFGNTIISLPVGTVTENGKLLTSNLVPSPDKIDTHVAPNTLYKAYYQYKNEYITRFIKIVDDTKPSKVEITARYASNNTTYIEDTWTKDDVILTLSSSDWTIPNELYGIGVVKFQYWDGSSWKDVEVPTKGTEISTAEVTINANKRFSYKFRSVDEEGNISDEAVFTIAIDKTAPSFETNYPTVTSHAAGYNSRTPIVTLKATDNVEVKDMCISMTGYCTDWADYSETYSYQTNITTHLDGSTKDFYISVRDKAGNIGKIKKTYTLSTAGLACSTYNRGSTITYGGVDWYVLTDNGTSTTLMTKTNADSSQTFGTSTAWASSNAKTKAENWFNGKETLKFEYSEGYILDQSSYSSMVRIPTKAEASGISNGSGTNFWTLTPYDASRMWYLTHAGSALYNTYSVSTSSSVACYYGYRKSSMGSMYRYNQSISGPSSASTIAYPNTTSNYINWTYGRSNNPCASNITDSSGKGPNTGHYGYGPFSNASPFCADIAPYYGDCGTGYNFCPSSSGSTSSCNRSYTTYTVYKNTSVMGIRPVIQVNERC